MNGMVAIAVRHGAGLAADRRQAGRGMGPTPGRCRLQTILAMILA